MNTPHYFTATEEGNDPTGQIICDGFDKQTVADRAIAFLIDTWGESGEYAVDIHTISDDGDILHTETITETYR